MPPDTHSPRTEQQSLEEIDASTRRSIPDHVRQNDLAPKLAGYVLAEPLGEGAYGQVWRSWQLRTRKEVAVKVFLQRTGLDWIFLQREVERLTRLDKHPHIVTLLDTNLDEEPPFYVMELVGKGSLQQWVTTSAPADPRRAVRWMAEIADALSYVHAKGLIHCDLKPANILLDDRERIRVVDFGQSRVFTESAASLGTLFYMAPEQAIPAQAGSPIQPDVRWDVYAFGATLYAILTGRVPYASTPNVLKLEQATTLAQRLGDYRKMIERDPRPPWDGCPVNPEVRAVIDKCMSPDVAKRYSAVAEVAADLQAIEMKRPVTPLAGKASYRAKKFIQRNPFQIGLAAAVIGLVAALGWLSTRQAKLDRGTAAKIMTDFAHDPQSAMQQATTARGRVAKFLGEISERYVSSLAAPERVMGARGAPFIAPEAFWQAVDRGPLWMNGEWLEVGRALGGWPDFAAPRLPASRELTLQLYDKIQSGTDAQKYVAFCMLGQIPLETGGPGPIPLPATAADLDPGVANAAGWAMMQLKLPVPPAASSRLLIDDVSGMVFAAIPASGDFRRGSPDSDPDRLPDEVMTERGVPITAFHMSITEVTLLALAEFWTERSEKLPLKEGERADFVKQFSELDSKAMSAIAAGYVSLETARAYCEWLNQRTQRSSTKRHYRLPTEEEWEYACRAGNTGRYCFGDDASYARYFAHCEGTGLRRHVVAQRMPNAFGLFDMHGGVWELTSSRYPSEFAQPEDASLDLYIRKGGGWYASAVRCRSAQRNYSTANAADLYTGFRLVLEVQP